MNSSDEIHSLWQTQIILYKDGKCIIIKSIPKSTQDLQELYPEENDKCNVFTSSQSYSILDG